MRFRRSFSKAVFNIFVAFFGCFFVIFDVFSMTSTNYTVSWDSINSGGSDVGTSTNFSVRDTVGEQGVGFSSSTNYTIGAGYRVGDKTENFIAFDIFGQNNATKIAYTAFASSTNSVTVSSAVSYSVGDYIAVVENLGFSELVSFGKISGINGLVITVDSWDGSQSSMSAVPAGGNDYVYKMSGSSVSMGTLSTSVENTALSLTAVRSSAQNGYTVYVNDDGNLRVDASTYIDDVTDGTVTLGQEEYGWRSYGSNASSTGADYAFATTTRAIQHDSNEALTEQRVALAYKASITSSSAAGSYGHIVYFTVTANY